MFTLIFWKDATERVISTFAGALLSAFLPGGLNALFPNLNLMTVDWKSALGFAAGTALVTLLKTLAATQVGDPMSASFLPSVRARVQPVGRHEWRRR